MDQISCGIWGCWPVPNGSSIATTTVAPFVLLNDDTTTTVEPNSTATFNDASEADIINILVAIVLLVEVCIVIALLVLLQRSEEIAGEESVSSWTLKINNQPEDKNGDESIESEYQERLIQWVDEQDGTAQEQLDLENMQSTGDQELWMLADSDQLVQCDNDHKVQICDLMYNEK